MADDPVERIELREYERSVRQIPDAVARSLASAEPTRLGISPTGAPGTWEIAATHHVGTIVLPGIEIIVRPKVSVENLFVLLDLGVPPDGWRDEVFPYGVATDLLPAFLAFFGRTVDQLTARGLVRSYRDRQERLTAVRGRIDLTTQMRRPGVLTPIACRYSDFTADVDENRFLAGVVASVLRMPNVPARVRAVLHHGLARFEDVVPVLPTIGQIDRIVFTRLNEHYRPALKMARLIVEQLTIQDRHGSTAAASFMVDMNAVFENFVTRGLHRALAGRLEVHAQVTEYLGVGNRVVMYPDLEFARKGSRVHVGDVKYKLSPSGMARTSDYFQLLAYCTALGLDEGVLIYARTDDGEADTEVVVRHAGVLLRTHRLDLAGGPDEIGRAVDALADSIWERAVLGRRDETEPGGMPSVGLGME